MDERSEITRLLEAHRDGDRGAVDRLFPLVYGELRRLAGSFLKGERENHTLQPTALVHEAYVRMLAGEEPGLADRAHFLALASRVMRHVLIDHARARKAQKRGVYVALDEALDSAATLDLDMMALDDALTRLAALSERQSRVVELRFFGGLSYDEIATALGESLWTVRCDWELARAWLRRELAGHSTGSGGDRLSRER
jgi:RNA polymerase sigma factor (TIGR02999 family)